MRGVETRIQEIRHRIFTEVARMAYHTEWSVAKRIEELPYKIIPGEVGNFRNDVFLERAIVGERLRLAMGLLNRGAGEHAPISDNIEAADRDETYYTPPLINIIKFACNGCAEKRVLVTEGCQGCLAHPCVEVCPKGAITLDRYNGRSHIDPEKCIKCGRCAEVCPYHAIITQERPCAAACGMDAIHTDINGKAEIDYDKCVSCGQCMVSCPFGAIADKSQIFQLIRAMQSGRKIIAQVAPAFAGQFGPKVTPEMFKTALKELGFADVYETALGADMGCMAEAEHYVKEVATGKQQFALTSCCPSWSVMAKNLFPETIDKISNELTPMVATARLIKQEHPDASVVFIGPCASKKLEASRRTVRSDVDFVITFEELTGMFEAKGILLDEIKAMDEMKDATAAGRGYGVAGGVANAIKECIEKYYPGTPVNIQHAESLAECKKALLLAKAGKMNGCLIEGMACPGGCIAGAGTNIAIPVAARAVDKFKNEAEKKVPDESVDQEMVELEKE